MCNLGEGVYERGEAQSIDQGLICIFLKEKVPIEEAVGSLLRNKRCTDTSYKFAE